MILKIGNEQIARKPLLRIAQDVFGWTFLVIGVLGLFLPLLQGVLFIVIGLTILSTRYAFAQRMLARLEKKYPDIYAKVEQLKVRFAASKPLLVAIGTILIVLLGVGIYLAVLGFKTAYAKIAPILLN
ncbi:MAG: hypothetical protein F4Z81_13345 [Gemmatimonadetes bacterium]|nr:hypothetical protein [Gemmatimonadota bacterium]MYB61764.1 hypothetical protein [Gemmatimonadota bacterium]